MNTNPKPKTNTLEKLQKTKHKLASPRDKEVNVTISKKDEPSMGRQLRFHLILPKSGAQKMQNPHNFCCWDVTYSSRLGQNPGISPQWHCQLCGLTGDEFWLDRQHPYTTSEELMFTIRCITGSGNATLPLPQEVGNQVGKTPGFRPTWWQKHEQIPTTVLVVNL